MVDCPPSESIDRVEFLLAMAVRLLHFHEWPIRFARGFADSNSKRRRDGMVERRMVAGSNFLVGHAKLVVPSPLTPLLARRVMSPCG